jgi:hypothetical protein
VELSENRIAVLPLVPAAGGDTALENLGNAVAARISANLKNIGDIETVSYQTIAANEAAAGGSLEDAAYWARDGTGAARVAHGSLVRTGDEVSFEVNLLSSDDLGAVAQASYTARPDDPRLLADSISWQILEQLWTAGEAPVEYYDHLIGRPFPAIRDFLLAEDFYTRGWEKDKATKALERAFKADTTLWAASIMYEYLIDEYDPSETSEVDSAIIEAHWRHIENAPTPYREFAEARDAPLASEERFQLFEEILAEHPRFWPAVMDYADDLAFFGFQYGYTAEEVIRAHLDCVDVEPGLLGCWMKLYLFSAGKDEAAFQRAYEYLGANLERIAAVPSGGPDPWYFAELHQFNRLFMAYEQGDPPASLLDSVARGPDWFESVSNPSFIVWNGGVPRIFWDLHRRRQELEMDAEIPPKRLYWDAYAWAMRGAWDSTLVALDRYRRESSDDQAPLLAFELTAVGEWLKALPVGASNQFLSGAMAVARLAGNQEQQHAPLTMLHSMLGILAASRGDVATLREAHTQLGTIDVSKARKAQRVLAAYALQLSSAVQRAADSLYVANWGPPSNWVAINRLNAARWLLATGDTVRASSLLSSCQRSMWSVYSYHEDLLLAGHCYLELARIEEARGRDGLARKYYWQFLKRYDSPVEALRPLVEEARAAYERVGGT